MSLRSSALWVGFSSALAGGLLLLAPVAQSQNVAQSRDTITLTLNVNFGYSGVVTVTMPDGTPVGTTTGSPTVIPAGFYSVQYLQPGCTDVPLFTLNGPGVHIEENLAGGEEVSDSGDANFQPNSTYTWKADSNPTIVHTFVTSSDVLGTPPPPAGAIVGALNPYTGKKHVQAGNTDLVGSGIAPFRGKLTAAVGPAGNLTLALAGKSTAALKAGRYTFAVTDRSKRNGFVLKTPKHKSLTVTGVVFMGKKSVSVVLTKGHWLFATGTGKAPHKLLVS